MDTLEEESFVLSFSSASDESDTVVGYLDDIIMDDEFQLLQRNFTNRYDLEFEDMEENKLIYTSIFNEYISYSFFWDGLLQQIPGLNTAAFTITSQHHKNEAAGDTLDMLLPSQILWTTEQKKKAEDRGPDLSSRLVLTSLCQSSVPASQNNLRHWVLPPANELGTFWMSPAQEAQLMMTEHILEKDRLCFVTLHLR
uniref:ADP-ribosylation factor-like protein 2-binding protein n=1 Tax=Piliocolobus tephrosceles TaxID=591936 RepID=A0A8C9LUD7_9PRIM